MTSEAVTAFCAVVAGNETLQTELCNAIAQNQGLERFVELAIQQGHGVTLESARQTFAEERERRDAIESEDHAETVVVKSKSSLAEEEADPGRAGFRRVALSKNWQIGEIPQSSGDSIHD